MNRNSDMTSPKAERNNAFGIELSERIKRVRIMREMNQLTLEQKGGLARGQVSRIESGERGMLLSAYVAIQIAEGFCRETARRGRNNPDGL